MFLFHRRRKAPPLWRGFDGLGVVRRSYFLRCAVCMLGVLMPSGIFANKIALATSMQFYVFCLLSLSFNNG